MAGMISEYFGYSIDDRSDAALKAAGDSWCPFIRSACTKSIVLPELGSTVSGACAIRGKSKGSANVICCPNRMYADDYRIITILAERVFGDKLPLCSGRAAVGKVKATGKPAVAVFGQRWGGELRLPQKDGRQSYFVDWIVAKVSPGVDGSVLEEFFAIEVQTIDTTGNYRDSLRALREDRGVAWSKAGFNWENVNKRILPQLIYKGSILARESKCSAGLFFVTPKPVYDAVMQRLGGESNLGRVGRLSAAAITCVAYDYDPNSPVVAGESRPLEVVRERMSSVYELRDTFNNARLPENDVYSHAIEAALDFAPHSGPLIDQFATGQDIPTYLGSGDERTSIRNLGIHR